MIEVQHLFSGLDALLIELLESLDAEDWEKQTVAKKWKVKDVAAHLLDGNIRALSIQRDRYYGEKPPKTGQYEDLVGWLNQLNADWVKAARRISPEVLVLLLKETGKLTTAYYESLPLYEQSVFPVAWAGEERSFNWMHLAREYTEKWHHQQQIREATDKPGILTKEFFHPLMDTFMQALPFTFKNTEATEGTVVKIVITGEAGSDWCLRKKKKGWRLTDLPLMKSHCTVWIPSGISWKLFSKSVRPDEIMDIIKIEGIRKLGLQVLEMIAVMA